MRTIALLLAFVGTMVGSGAQKKETTIDVDFYPDGRGGTMPTLVIHNPPPDADLAVVRVFYWVQDSLYGKLLLSQVDVVDAFGDAHIGIRNVPVPPDKIKHVTVDLVHRVDQFTIQNTNHETARRSN